jgi:hypothetical protein
VVLAEGGRPAAGRLAGILQSHWPEAGTAHRDRVAAIGATLLRGHGLSGHLPLERAVALATAVAASPQRDPARRA